ncbi:hypothetical protein JNN96_33015 [Mycobacterium sp. DSM 3803]|nr:hypothetical protein [Mycobacterium sp. DSM 3803]
MSDDNEPTWGNSVPGPNSSGSAAKPVPNQRSMPVVGRRVPPAAPQPHADYERQAAQHFGTPAPRAAQPNPMSYPVVGRTPAMPPVSYPVVPARPASGPPPTAYPPGRVRDSFIQRLMQRGVRGELIRQPWFHDLRQRNADPFVYGSFALGVVVSLVLSVIPSSFVVTVLTTSLWIGIGFLYFALGTKLAHQFTLFGICLVGGLVMSARALFSMVVLSSGVGRYYGYRYESVPELMFVLLINLAGVAAFAYIGIQVHRGIQQLSHP